MKTLSLDLDDRLDAEFERVSSEAGRAKQDIVKDIVRRFVDVNKRKRLLLEPRLTALAAELADENRALGEAGMEEYAAHLERADSA